MPILITDGQLRTLLESARTIAVVGLSDNPARDSHRVSQYLLYAGYTIIPVNPSIREVFNIPAVPNLDSVTIPIDIVDIFRRAEVVPEVVEAAIRAHVGAIWMQFGTYHAGAAQRASAAGLRVVPDRCIMVEHQRLIQ
jgi:hypothetical protein